MRQLFFDYGSALEEGLWLIRLKAPFDRSLFTSAASEALRLAVRHELSELLGRAGKSGG